jgi:hypothetical protein
LVAASLQKPQHQHQHLVLKWPQLKPLPQPKLLHLLTPLQPKLLHLLTPLQPKLQHLLMPLQPKLSRQH